jgi:hypothetical protein
MCLPELATQAALEPTKTFRIGVVDFTSSGSLG